MRSGMDKYLLKSMQPLELVETIRTVHRGGTLIDRGMSHKLVAQLETDNGGDDPSLIKATSAYKKLGSATGRKRCKKPGRLSFWNNPKLCILVAGVDHTV